jgi:hypothetical protein
MEDTDIVVVVVVVVVDNTVVDTFPYISASFLV